MSLVLLDEIEEAPREVFDLLLAMLGKGRMTDIDGNLVDFSMTIVVMTSNLGVQRAGSAGFAGNTQDPRVGLISEVRKHFRPEFFHRADHVVPFGALTPKDILAVVELELELELAKAGPCSGFVRRGLSLRATSAAKAQLVALGFYAKRGARPLRRVIEERIVGRIAIRSAGDPKLWDQVVHIVFGESDRPSRSTAGELIVAPQPTSWSHETR